MWVQGAACMWDGGMPTLLKSCRFEHEQTFEAIGPNKGKFPGRSQVTWWCHHDDGVPTLKTIENRTFQSEQTKSRGMPLEKAKNYKEDKKKKKKSRPPQKNSSLNIPLLTPIMSSLSDDGAPALDRSVIAYFKMNCHTRPRMRSRFLSLTIATWHRIYRCRAAYVCRVIEVLLAFDFAVQITTQLVKHSQC